MDYSIKGYLNRLSVERLEEVLKFCKENNDHYKGDLSARQNGSEGGPIGGEMVKRMIKSYEENMK